ncbi:MAG: sigma-54-dependent transcriptional regulator [Gemmatimonadota bacterium]
MTNARRLLVVDDDRAFRLSTSQLLRDEGYVVDLAEDGRTAVSMLQSATYDLLLLDLRMPGIDGLQLVEALRLWGHKTPVLMISGFGTVDLAVRSLHLGADDFLTKPVEPDVLASRIAALLDSRPTESPSVDAGNPGGIVGRSAAMREVSALIRRVATLETTVLVTGETGVGKELVARAIHGGSPRAGSRWVAVNCGALAEGLLESELFGHVRGAFSGAVRDRVGVFEAAAGGTLFLDEVGEMSLGLQQRLLRAVQEREVVPVGATRPLRVDVRIIAATSRDLLTMVHDGTFRDDLYYRLAVFRIEVPPLRDRAEDVPLLVEHALGRLRARVREWRDLSCTPFAMRALRSYSWPGNVRHMMGAVESAAVQAEGGRIEVQHLPHEVRAAMRDSSGERYRSPSDSLAEAERIRTMLEFTGGSLSRAADLLGMGRTTLWRKMKSLAIETDSSPR